MGIQPNRDFASLLDDLIAASQADTGPVSRPSIPFDYLDVVEELHSGRIQVSSDAVAAEYAEMGEDVAVEALFAVIPPDLNELPIEPEAISRELKLGEAKQAAEFARIRRAFAFKNHPDRLPDHMRERAIQRMQVANMLIDEARKRALAGARR